MQKFIYLLICLFSITGFSQETEFKLGWDEKKPLSWNDFQGEPHDRIPFSASTNSGISYSWSLETRNGVEDFQYEVRSNFYPNLSWIKDGKHDPHLLAHEQLHFDISELHARKFRKAIEEYQISKDIKKDLREIYYRIESERQEMQEKYDAESNHGLQFEAEKEWQLFVKEELKKYEGFGC